MRNNNQGFTLVELMITLAMTGIIIAAVYSTYTVQQRAYGRQDQIMEIQQTLRATMYGMVQDIRMAGYDPKETSKASFTDATATSLKFSMDNNSDGDTDDTGEEISYNLDKTTLKRDSQPFATNIEKIEFLYNKGLANEATDMSSNLNDIRSVTISLIGRAKNRDANYTDEHDKDNPYRLASQTKATTSTWYPNAKDSHYRRQLIITTVQCRNMGF